MRQTKIYLEWCENPVREFRTGVSLHSHTLHSRESLDFIHRSAERAALHTLDSQQRRSTPSGEARASSRFSAGLVDSTVCALRCLDAGENHIEERLQLKALVSLTDHDEIEAPLSLQALESCRGTPISLEWSVPYEETFFHLGIHNIPVHAARQVFRGLEEFTAAPEKFLVSEILRCLSEMPEILIVFNHPCWDEKGIGPKRHVELAADFVRRYHPFIHALELNSFRPWKQNRQVLQMARALGKPLVAGGDRHGFEANTVLDLSNAGTFSEYVQQVRAGWANILVTN